MFFFPLEILKHEQHIFEKSQGMHVNKKTGLPIKIQTFNKRTYFLQLQRTELITSSKKVNEHEETKINDLFAEKIFLILKLKII